MKPEDAEEYTQALGQVVAGGWRQIALGQRLGVPEALGLSNDEWVTGRLGGYVRLSFSERREAIAELMAEGMTTREMSEVFDVTQRTIQEDAKALREDGRIPSEQAEHEGEPANPVRATQKPSTFNRVNDNIGWARWSWNPVTGCLHNCDYCYARDIAQRFTGVYRKGFEPDFWPERLDAPANTTLPAKTDGDESWRRVFTCSMADLFGEWVPQEWITAVFNAIDQHRQWQYLCLTKFPQRLAQLEWPENVWAGTTVDRQHRVAVAERAFSKVTAGVKWLSCEPLLEPLKFKSLAMFDWVVIGASTGSAHAQPFAPPFEWVVDLYEQARAAGCRVYLKHNLFGSPDGRGPGMVSIQEWPR